MGRVIVSLRIEPDGGPVPAGSALQLKLFGLTAGGGTDLIPANMATWQSSNPAIAEVSRQGRLNPHKAGPVIITATYAGQVAKADLSIQASPGDA